MFIEPTDAQVYELAERMDCSLLLARNDLRCEAYAAAFGTEVDYRMDCAAIAKATGGKL